MRRVSVGGAAGGAAGAGGGGGAAASAHVDPEFARELAEAFQQYEAMQRDGWRGATDKAAAWRRWRAGAGRCAWRRCWHSLVRSRPPP